jgi:hypothetical protein
LREEVNFSSNSGLGILALGCLVKVQDQVVSLVQVVRHDVLDHVVVRKQCREKRFDLVGEGKDLPLNFLDGTDKALLHTESSEPSLNEPIVFDEPCTVGVEVAAEFVDLLFTHMVRHELFQEGTHLYSRDLFCLFISQRIIIIVELFALRLKAVDDVLAAEGSFTDHEALGVVLLGSNEGCVSEEDLEWYQLKEIYVIFNYSKV